MAGFLFGLRVMIRSRKKHLEFSEVLDVEGAPTVNDNLPGVMPGHEMSDLRNVSRPPAAENVLHYSRVSQIGSFPDGHSAAAVVEPAEAPALASAPTKLSGRTFSHKAPLTLTGVLSILLHGVVFAVLLFSPMPVPEDPVEEAGSIVSVTLLGDSEFDAMAAGDPDIIQAETVEPDQLQPSETQPLETPPVEPMETVPAETATVQPTAPVETTPTEVVPTEVQPTEVQPTEVLPTEVTPPVAAEPIEAEPMTSVEPQVLTSLVPTEPVVSQPVPTIVPEAVETVKPEEVTTVAPVTPPPEEIKPIEDKPVEKPVAKKPVTKKPVQKPKPVSKTKTKTKAGNSGEAAQDQKKGSSDGNDNASSNTNGSKAAGRTSASGSAAVANYPGKVQSRIRRSVRVPSAFKRQNISATVRVRLTISSSGSLSQVSVARSSGVSELDQAVVDGVRRAAPFPPLPPEWGKPSWSFTQEVQVSGR